MLMSIPCFSQQTLTSVDEINFRELSKYNTQRNGDYGSILKTWYLLTLFQDNPRMSVSAAEAKLTDFDQQLISVNGGKKYNDISSYLNDIAVGVSAVGLPKPFKSIGVGAAALSFLYRSGSDLYTRLTNNATDNYFSNQLNGYNLGVYATNLVLDDAWKLSQTNLSFGTVLNAATGASFNASPFENVEQLMTHNPDFANQVYTKDMLQKIEANQLMEGDLVTQFSNKLNELNESERQNNELITRALQNQATQQEIENQAQIDNIKLQTASAAINIFSGLAFAFGNKKLANDITVLGNNAIQVASAIDKFDQVASKFGNGGKSVSSIILSGDIVAAVINIFSYFSSGPTPEQQIMEQINGLAKMVDTLYVHMNKRFDIVDEKLDTIYSTMIKGFDALQKQQIVNAEILSNLSVSQAALQTKLYSMDKSIMNRLDQSFKDNLLTTCSEIFSYKDVIKDGTMTNDQFTSYLLTLGNGVGRSLQYSTMMNDALTFTNTDLYDNFSRRCDNELPINLFKDILRTKVVATNQAATLPDPGIWMTSTSALLKLVNDFPKIAKRKVNIALLDNYIAQGQAILDFQTSLKSYKDSTGTHPNYKIIDALLKAYKDNAKKFIDNIYWPTCNQIVANEFNSVTPFAHKGTSFPAITHVDLAVNGKSFKNDDTTFYKYLDTVDFIPQTLGLGTIRLDFTKVKSGWQGWSYKFTKVSHSNVAGPGTGVDYCDGEQDWTEDLDFGFNFSYVTADGISTPFLIYKYDYGDGEFPFRAYNISYQRYWHDSATHQITSDFKYIRFGNKLYDKDPETVFKENFKTISAFVQRTFNHGLKDGAIVRDTANWNKLQTKYFKKAFQARATAYMTELERDFLNVSTNPIGSNAKASLDLYYQLIYEYCKIAFPNDLSTDEDLLRYLTGKSQILCTNSCVKIIDNSINNLKDGYNSYSEFDPLVYLEVRTQHLTEYIHAKLDADAKNSENNTFDDIAFNINLLKLERKILTN